MSNMNQCKVEKEANKKACKVLGFCTGLPREHRLFIDGCDRSAEKIPYGECIRCKKYLYRKVHIIIFNIIILCFLLLCILIMCTPQGAIKRKLFVQSGANIAFISEIEKVEDAEGIGSGSYLVTVKGNQREWKVFSYGNIYFAEIKPQ